MGRVVTLGAHEYEVCPQKIGYLINRLGPRLQEALEAEVDGVEGAALIGAKAHDVLKAFIPDLMPVHEFLGYASDEAMRAGNYSEATDLSPEPLQIKDAFKAASDVNGGEVLGHLKALLGPTLTQRAVAAITAAVSESARSTTSAPSPTSQPLSGGSDPTSSGTTPQTSEPSAA
jgi:hypothetical protein